MGKKDLWEKDLSKGINITMWCIVLVTTFLDGCDCADQSEEEIHHDVA